MSLLKNLYSLNVNNSFIILNKYFNRDGTNQTSMGLEPRPNGKIFDNGTGLGFGAGLMIAFGEENVILQNPNTPENFNFVLSNTDFKEEDLLSSFDNTSLIITKINADTYTISSKTTFQRSLFLLDGSTESIKGFGI